MKEVLLLAIILFILSVPSLVESDGLSFNLINRDSSPLSPYYNSSMSQSDILINAAFRSISRAKRLSSFIDPGQSKAAQTDFIPNDSTYLMQIFIGTPPIQILAKADTGSDLSWIQCLPCLQCYKQTAPIFNPKKSTTYRDELCDSKACMLLKLPSCGASGECRYEVVYGDNSLTVGNLATDTVSFNNSIGRRIIKYPNIVLGCGHTNIGRFRPTGEGIIGLGGGPLSLVSQLGNKVGKRKFAYCLLPLYQTTGNNKLKFGVDTQINRRGVVSTPLVSKLPKTFYHITLTGISINGHVVKPIIRESGNIIVDSGTTLTFLNSDLYDQVEAAISEAIDETYPDRGPPAPYKLCYTDGSIKKFPSITFQFFASPNELKVYPIGLFGRVKGRMCLLIIPTDGIQIIGNLLQVYHNVEFDIDKKMISFARSNCDKKD
ncbi:hypothetical protein RIF29_38679 [Crotalaria pallida]|uniref:Peptidase A1 domain-containing protein n=1 Tax=Crotalaria pallida TaxID=3830 RepID=A0AAN9E1N1_CROPI